LVLKLADDHPLIVHENTASGRRPAINVGECRA